MLVNGDIAYVVAGRDRGQKGIITCTTDPKIMRVYLYEKFAPHFTEVRTEYLVSVTLDRAYTEDEQRKLVYAGVKVV